MASLLSLGTGGGPCQSRMKLFTDSFSYLESHSNPRCEKGDARTSIGERGVGVEERKRIEGSGTETRE